MLHCKTSDCENMNLLKQTTASSSVGLVDVLMISNQAKEAKHSTTKKLNKQLKTKVGSKRNQKRRALTQ